MKTIKCKEKNNKTFGRGQGTFEAHFQSEAPSKNDSNDLKHSLQHYGTL